MNPLSYNTIYTSLQRQFDSFCANEIENVQKGETPWPKYHGQYDKELRPLTQTRTLNDFMDLNFEGPVKILELFGAGHATRNYHKGYGLSFTALDHRTPTDVHVDNERCIKVLPGNFYSPEAHIDISNTFFQIDNRPADIFICIPFGGFSDVVFFEEYYRDINKVRRLMSHLYLHKLKTYLPLLSPNGYGFTQIPKIMGNYLRNNIVAVNGCDFDCIIGERLYRFEICLDSGRNMMCFAKVSVL